jgi:hypothetical protein
LGLDRRRQRPDQRWRIHDCQTWMAATIHVTHSCHFPQSHYFLPYFPWRRLVTSKWSPQLQIAKWDMINLPI